MVHLYLCTLLLLPPLVLSQEISNAASSGHFGFFTEVGFWLQEIVMALAGLASLGAFWALLKVGRISNGHPMVIVIIHHRTHIPLLRTSQHLEPPTVFLVVGLKDFFLPFLFSFLFGNPLPTKDVSGSKLSAVQQLLALLAVGAYQIADSWPQAVVTSADQGGRAKDG